VGCGGLSWRVHFSRRIRYWLLAGTLPFLQRFIDAKLVAFKVVDAQRESLTRPQTTHSKNSQHEVLPRLHLLGAEKLLARFLAAVWQCETVDLEYPSSAVLFTSN